MTRSVATRVLGPMDRHKSDHDKSTRVLRNSHPQGARFAYDGGHAPNAETFTNRVAVTVRSGSPATRRDLDGPGRDSAGSPSVSFPGAAGQRAATRGRQGTRTGLRRSHVRGEFRHFEC